MTNENPIGILCHSSESVHQQLMSLQVQTLSDVNQQLQSSLADTTKAHQAERLKRDNLHKQVLVQPCMRVTCPAISRGPCAHARPTALVPPYIIRAYHINRRRYTSIHCLMQSHHRQPEPFWLA